MALPPVMLPTCADWPLRHLSIDRASLRTAAIIHPGAARQVMALRISPAQWGWLARHVFSCRLLSGGRWSTRSPRLPAPAAFKAVPARLSGSSSISGRGAVNRTPEILLPKQATCHWPTPRITGCGRRNRTGSPAYETGVLPLHHLRTIMAPQVRIERTTTRLTAARSTH